MSDTNLDRADRFPFSDVVGQDEAKLALRLAALDPQIGGVLLRGEKGSAKTTLARGLAGLLGPTAPFVELPLGATEDRLVGSIDLGAALGGEGVVVKPGLLALSDGGVLYVDEINLLADHLVDLLLDVAVSGVNRIERDGITHTHPARFVLVGSMNPEEGELRPQLLDRFGLSVAVAAPTDVATRAEITRRRLAFDTRAVRAPSDGAVGIGASTRETSGVGGSTPIDGAIAGVSPAGLAPGVIESASRLALEVGAEGLRADLALCRAAAARAGLAGRDVAGLPDLEAVAGMVLGHRRRRAPFDPPTFDEGELADALDAALGPERDDPDGDGAPAPGRGEVPEGRGGPTSPPSLDADGLGSAPDGGGTSRENGADGKGVPDVGAPQRSAQRGSDDESQTPHPRGSRPEAAPPGLEPTGDRGGPASEPIPQDVDQRTMDTRPRAAPSTDRSTHWTNAQASTGSTGDHVIGSRGHVVGEASHLDRPDLPFSVVGTVRRLAERRSDAPEAVPTPDDLVGAVRSARAGRLLVLCVDTSGSMGARERVDAAIGTVLGLLADAYRRRDQVALIVFRAGRAELVLPPTGSIEVARLRLADLGTGGDTPLAEGLDKALELLTSAQVGAGGHVPRLVILTDGRATAGEDAVERSERSADRLAAAGVEAIVLDCESGVARLGLARRLADRLGAEYVPAHDLDPQGWVGNLSGQG